MPPKKKEDEVVVTGYDLTIMKTDDLRQYVNLLQSEIERNRRDISYFLKERDKFQSLLEASSEEITARHAVLLMKDVEIEELKPKFGNQRQIMEDASTYLHEQSKKMKLQQKCKISMICDADEALCLQEEQKLENSIQEKCKEINALRIHSEIAVKNLKKVHEINIADVRQHQRVLIENSLQSYVKEFLKIREDYRLQKEAAVSEAREYRLRGEKKFEESCTMFMRQLQVYYNDITRRDMDKIKELRNKIEEVKKSADKCNSRLKQTVSENRILKVPKRKRVPMETHLSPNNKLSQSDILKKRVAALKSSDEEIDKLLYDNLVLKRKLRFESEERDRLRTRLVHAIRLISEKAELKTLFTQMKLMQKLQGRDISTILTSGHHNDQMPDEIQSPENRSESSIETEGTNSAHNNKDGSESEGKFVDVDTASFQLGSENEEQDAFSVSTDSCIDHANNDM